MMVWAESLSTLLCSTTRDSGWLHLLDDCFHGFVLLQVLPGGLDWVTAIATYEEWQVRTQGGRG
jgi:hypothetical protein